MKRLRRLARRDDAQAYALRLRYLSTRLLASVEAAIGLVDDCDVCGASQKELLELAAEEAGECIATADAILLSGEASLGAYFA